MKVYYSHGHERDGQRNEWWWVTRNGLRRFVQITFDAAWFTREGSINDLKEMAIAVAQRQEHTK